MWVCRWFWRNKGRCMFTSEDKARLLLLLIESCFLSLDAPRRRRRLPSFQFQTVVLHVVYIVITIPTIPMIFFWVWVSYERRGGWSSNLNVRILFLANRCAYTNVSSVWDTATCSPAWDITWINLDQGRRRRRLREDLSRLIFLFIKICRLQFWRRFSSGCQCGPTEIRAASIATDTNYYSSSLDGFSVSGAQRTTDSTWVVFLGANVLLLLLFSGCSEQKINEVKFKIYNIFIIFFSLCLFLGNFIWYEKKNYEVWKRGRGENIFIKFNRMPLDFYRIFIWLKRWDGSWEDLH